MILKPSDVVGCIWLQADREPALFNCGRGRYKFGVDLPSSGGWSRCSAGKSYAVDLHSFQLIIEIWPAAK